MLACTERRSTLEADKSKHSKTFVCFTATSMSSASAADDEHLRRVRPCGTGSTDTGINHWVQKYSNILFFKNERTEFSPDQKLINSSAKANTRRDERETRTPARGQI